MNAAEVQRAETPDPAAIFAAALSLWEAWTKAESMGEELSLSDSYNGMDEFMRQVMRVADLFERWSCDHVFFDALDPMWPYLLHDKFGPACRCAMMPGHLDKFDATDCLRVAMSLQLPMRHSSGLPIPADTTAINPVPHSEFVSFRIQSVRDANEGQAAVPYTFDDEPFDEAFGSPYYALYGIRSDAVQEHIAMRPTFADLVRLAECLAPGIRFPA